MNEIKININGIDVLAQDGDTVLQAAQKFGIDIPNLCHNEMVKVYGACGLCVVEAEGIPKLLRACATKVSEGMVINTETERVVRARKIALELLMSDHDGDCRGPCTLNCPAGTDCQGYVKLIAEGKYHEAVELIKDKLPLPASIGRVCPHPCENKCRRGKVEEPISIAYLKSFAADYDLKQNTFVPEKQASTGKKVGIIGGGPGGLTAAYYLALKGHNVTIVDAMPKMGGMLRYGIPEYRLPKAVLDSEIELISNLGVEMINNYRVGKDIDFDTFKSQYDAVLVAIGAWNSSKMGVEGENLEGIFGGIDFLREVSLGNIPEIGKRVAVTGGGNTAMDACRTAVRLGAEEVYVIYRRTEAEMPAEQIEIDEAKEEGVIFKFLTNPVEFIGENGKVKGVKLQKMMLGEPDAGGRRRPVPIEGEFEFVDLDSVIVAIGQYVNTDGFEGLKTNKRGIIEANELDFTTSEEGVFAVGDATNNGADIAISAIGEANRSAIVIDRYLKGEKISCNKPYFSEKNIDNIDFEKYEKIPRAKMPGLSPEERKDNFKEIIFGLSEDVAVKEAKRCLECGCHDYDECKLIKYSRRYNVHPERFEGEVHHRETDQKLAVIERDPDKCILCGLCVRACDEVAQKGILSLMQRGFDSVVKAEFKDIDIKTICGQCLVCAKICPTGALRIL